MKVRISSPHGLAGSTQVELDGKPCHTLTAVRFEAHADGDFARVQVETVAQGFEYDGEAIVSVGPETAALLRKLGWREPEPDTTPDPVADAGNGV